MEAKARQSLGNEASLRASSLGNYGPTDAEYQKELAALTKIIGVLNDDTKMKENLESNGRREIREVKKYEDELALKKSEFKLNKKKFEYQMEADKIKNDLELAKINYQIQSDKYRNELELKKVELQQQTDRINQDIQRLESRNRLICSIITSTIPVLLVQIPALIIERNMGYRCLNMEYVDNGITPRTTNEAIKNIKNFIRK